MKNGRQVDIAVDYQGNVIEPAPAARRTGQRRAAAPPAGKRHSDNTHNQDITNDHDFSSL